ncbi:MAG: PIN domain-containing protein [Bryobacteraceae bacterium]|jgi:predicted nucleic acid-binding protein
MPIYLLDTPIVIDALNQKRGRWAALVEAGDTLACSVVTLTEIYAGIRPKEFAFTERFLDGLEHYELDSHLAHYAGLLKNEWAKKGRSLAVVDLIIAATALAHNLVLMTDNREDFPMTELTLYPLP